MTWRSCADDPPERNKEVLVRYDVTHPARDVQSYAYACAYWFWNGLKKRAEWEDVNHLNLSDLEVFDEAEWMELPK